MALAKRLSAAGVLTFFAVLAICCGQDVRAPKATVPPTSTPTPMDTPTALQVYTPFRAHSPDPTGIPLPTTTSTPRNMADTSQTARPIPSPNKWLGGGNWLRGIQSEEYLAYSMKERGEHRRDVHIVALNPHPDGWAEDLQLQLVCINDRRSMYVRPFKQDVPPDVDSFVVGMWDFASDDWMAGEIHLYYEPVLTNDGGSIYLNDQVQIQQVFAVIQNAHRSMNINQVMIIGIYASDDDPDSGLWSEFDPLGFEDAVEYLPCF